MVFLKKKKNNECRLALNGSLGILRVVYSGPVPFGKILLYDACVNECIG